MPTTPPPAPGRRPLQLLGLVLALVLGLWLAFFDSHSLVRRLGWAREHGALAEENARLQAEIEWLEARLDSGLTPQDVEKIAREQYGMRRPGEMVYRLDAERDTPKK